MKRLFLMIISLLISVSTLFGQELKATKLLNSRIEIAIPANFSSMPDELIKIKYPASNYPSTNSAQPRNVFLKSPESKKLNAKVKSYLEVYLFEELGANPENLSFYLTLHKSPYADSIIIDNGLKDIDGKKVGFLEVISTKNDVESYILLFFTDLDNQLLRFIFFYEENEINEYRKIALEMMNSLKIN